MTSYGDALDDAFSSLELECRDDYVGLWSVLWRVRQRPVLSVSPALQREATLELVARLLDEAPGAVAGQFTLDTHEFQVWSGPTDQIVERIAREWNAMDRELIGGDIVWLTINSP
ncbi:MAG: hypothetical protein ABSH07_04495 [Candidatus Dormibacteria bacterium]|jgi:hypothetical protein